MFPVCSATGVMWYLSAMMAVILIFLCFIPRHKQIFSNCVAPFIVMFVYGVLYARYHSAMPIMEPFDSNGFIMCGLMRAMAGMSLGIIAFNVVSKLKYVKFNTVGHIVLSTIEGISYISVILMGIFIKTNSEFTFVVVLLLFIGITITFSCQSYSSTIFSATLWENLGKFTLYLFMNHYYYAVIFSMYFQDISTDNRLAIYFVLAFITSIVVKIITEKLLQLNLFSRLTE